MTLFFDDGDFLVDGARLARARVASLKWRTRRNRMFHSVWDFVALAVVVGMPSMIVYGAVSSVVNMIGGRS